MKQRFSVTVEVEDVTGRIVAVYFQIREGKAAEVREFADGKAFANYSRKGELLGIELLAPCDISVLDKITKEEPSSPLRRAAREFILEAAPRKMLRDSGHLIGA